MIVLREFFLINRPLLLFVYGQTFFVLGLAIFLQSRRHSRLRLARDLRWLAVFGVLHGIYEWGDIFITLESQHLSILDLQLLLVLRTLLLALSFICLLLFGVSMLEDRWPRARWLFMLLPILWLILAWVTFAFAPTSESWLYLSTIWARYLLGLSGGLVAAYGLLYQAEHFIAPLRVRSIYRTLRTVGIALLIYGVLAGAIVAPADFFPANILNKTLIEGWIGVPIEVFRSVVGIVLTLSMIRVLEIFEIEIDRIIEGMESDQIKSVERERIGQEIHDGAIQAVYSASLILESITPKLKDNEEATIGLDRTKRVLANVVADLRRYMTSLRSDIPEESLVIGLHRIITDPRFSSLLRIQLKHEIEPNLNPLQIGHILAIVQESLSNTVRHAKAHHATVDLHRVSGNLILQVMDDGQGFCEQEITPGFGLRSVKDRARLLGGQLVITSQQGKGTTITLSIPEENGL